MTLNYEAIIQMSSNIDTSVKDFKYILANTKIFYLIIGYNIQFKEYGNSASYIKPFEKISRFNVNISGYRFTVICDNNVENAEIILVK